MGMLFSRSSPSPPPFPVFITPAEHERLILLGNTSGAPVVVEDAIRSGNIMDPAHMQRAERMNDEWEKGAALLQPYFLRQKRVDEERTRLRELGEKMGGSPVRASYASIRAKIGPRPPAGSMLRIQTQDHGHVDMTLTEHEHSMEDCLFEAAECVPKFRAFVQQPEPVLVFEHGVR